MIQSPLQVVGAIIENDVGEILLAQRPPGKSYAGYWEFPGGKIEAQETLEQALGRELDEELKLRFETKQVLGRFPYTYEWGELDLHIVIVKPLNAPEITEAIHNFRWLRPSEVKGEQLTPADVLPWQRYLEIRGITA